MRTGGGKVELTPVLLTGGCAGGSIRKWRFGVQVRPLAGPFLKEGSGRVAGTRPLADRTEDVTRAGRASQ
jgi:hypothetical protein